MRLIHQVAICCVGRDSGGHTGFGAVIGRISESGNKDRRATCENACREEQALQTIDKGRRMVLRHLVIGKSHFPSLREVMSLGFLSVARNPRAAGLAWWSSAIRLRTSIAIRSVSVTLRNRPMQPNSRSAVSPGLTSGPACWVA